MLIWNKYYDGAIKAHSGNITINNSKFMNNNCSIAIIPSNLTEDYLFKSEYATNLTVTNTQFESNNDEFGSGILYVGPEGSNLLLSNDTFKSNNNTENIPGGIVYAEILGEITIEDSIFDSNMGVQWPVALQLYGLSNKTTRINNCSFTSNNANNTSEYLEDDSIANIISFGDVIVNQTIFDSNNGSYHGTLGITSAGNVSILNSNFTSNNASISGALYCIPLNNELTDILTSYGYDYKIENNVKIDNCKFKDNTALIEDKIDINGVVTIISNGDATINNSIFDSNKASNNGALYIENSGKTTISNTKFNSNTAITEELLYTEQYDYYERKTVKTLQEMVIKGGAITCTSLTQENIVTPTIEENTVNIENCSFTNNKVISYDYKKMGGAIYASNKTLNINNSQFTNNNQDPNDSNGGAITAQNTNLTINNTKFEQNNALRGGAIYYEDEQESQLTIENSTFTKSKYSKEAIVYITTKGNTTINNSTFKDNNAEYTATIYYNDEANNNLIINNTKFESNGNMDCFDAAAITIERANNMSITNSEFIKNQATYGAIIINNANGTLSIKNTTFDSNKALYASGAINIHNTGKATLENNTYKNNFGYESGALFYSGTMDSQLEITDSEFAYNGYDETNEITSSASTIRFETDGNITISNSNFHDNTAEEEGTISYNGYYNATNVLYHTDETNTTITKYYKIQEEYSNLTITNTNFTGNRGTNTSVLTLRNGNININNSNFINNTIKSVDNIIAGDGLVINSECYLTINNTNFTGNGINLNEDNQNNEFNITMGSVIYQKNRSIIIDNSNFKSNIGSLGGSPIMMEGETTPIITGELPTTDIPTIGEPKVDENHTTIIVGPPYPTINTTYPPLPTANETYPTLPIIINGTLVFPTIPNATLPVPLNDTPQPSTGNNTTINKTTETIILNPITTTIILNHTNITNNKVIIKELLNYDDEKIFVNYAPGINIMNVDAHIDNTQFISNKVEKNITEKKYTEDTMGIITFYPYNEEQVCNVTNCVFADNNPSNFILEDNQIKLITSMNGQLTDNYIPYYGNVTIYYDENNNAIKSNLTTTIESYTDMWGNQITNEPYNTRIEETINNDSYLCKIIIDQNEKSEQYGIQNFYNNTYYFLIPHEYIISVETNSPTELGDNITIKGKIYYTKSDNTQVTFPDKEVNLYINGTYIQTTTTNTTGEYEFNFTTNKIGTHNITVTTNQTITLPQLTNTTTFNVNIQTKITLTSQDNTIGTSTKITGKLTTIKNKEMKNTNLTIYINNEEYNIQTDDNSEFTIEYTPTNIGKNYVLAFYQGNQTHIKSTNSTIFNTNKIKTTTTINITNKQVNNLTINTDITGEDNQKITNGTIIIYTQNNQILQAQNIEQTKTITITNITSGTYTLTITYTGNDTYQPSNTTQTITITPEAQIKIEIKNTTEGNVEIEYTATNDKQEPLKQQEINITLPNGTTTTQKTDNQGKITITDKTATLGNKTTQATIQTTNNLKGTTQNKNITITPNYQKIIEEQNKTIQEQNKTIEGQNKTIQEQNKTIQEQNKIIEDQNKTIQNQNKTIDNLNNTVQDQNKTIQEQNKTIEEQNKTIEGQNKTIQEQNKTIEDQNKTISDLNNTVQEQNKTIQEQNKTIDDQNKTIQNQNKTIDNLNNTVQNQNKTINDQNKTIQDQNKTIENQNKTIQEQNKTIENQNKTIQDLNNTVQEQNKTINEQNKTIEEQNKTIEEQNKTIEEQNKTIHDQNNTINNQNKTIQNQIDEIKDLQDTIDTLNNTSNIKAVPENNTVGNTKVVVSLDDKLGNPISNAPITVKNSKGETIGEDHTDKNGVAIIPVNTTSGTENITVTYAGDNKTTPSTTTTSITTTKHNVTITVDPISGVIGEDITLTAHVNDDEGNPVNGGNLVFKLNGKTLRTDGRFDSNTTAWKILVNNGLVNISIKADLYLRNAKNITASYSGSYKYNEAKSNTETAQIKKRDATITVTASPKTQKQYQTITFTAKLTDTTPNHKNTTAINIDNKVLFKINGITIKNTNGKNLLVNVNSKDEATYNYTVPQGMGGITKDGKVRNYTVETLLVSNTYYPDTRNTTNFNVERSPITISTDKVLLNNKNQLTIKATIKDYKNNNVIGNNTVAIKINGKTYVNPKTGKTENFKAVNGKLDIAGLELSKNVTVKKVMIVTGARQAYQGQRVETNNIIKA